MTIAPQPPLSVEALDAELSAKISIALAKSTTREQRNDIVLHVCLEAVRWYPGLRETRKALGGTYL